MKITFLLPVPAHNPLGGAKVVYEYANGLAAKGHNVTVVHTLAPTTVERGVLFSSATYIARALGFRGGVGPRRWMPVHPGVTIKWVPSLRNKWIPDGDIVIATSWHTAEFALTYSEKKGRKYYFVQDFEFYMTAPADIKARMAATYKSGFLNFAISPACEEMIRECGGEVLARLPNGLDHEKFQLTNPIESETRTWIGFPVRKEPFKRTQDAIAICAAIRNTDSGKNIQFWGFGAQKPDYWPEWITFAQRPSDDELVAWYNRSKIFIVPSEYEGWGLPGSEAMCCGATLISTRNGGVDAYAENGSNALLFAPGDIEGISKAAVRLIEEPDERIKMANKAERNIRRFDWITSINKIESKMIKHS